MLEHIYFFKIKIKILKYLAYIWKDICTIIYKNFNWGQFLEYSYVKIPKYSPFHLVVFSYAKKIDAVQFVSKLLKINLKFKILNLQKFV